MHESLRAVSNLENNLIKAIWFLFMAFYKQSECHYRLPSPAPAPPWPRSVQAIASVLVSAAHPNTAASFDFLHNQAKVGRLSAKEFYNVVVLQHKVHCTLKEIDLPWWQ